ncbi:MAG: carboxypeptidase M32 [Parachlamydiales bacterium]|nr:carboxypeptidase M32 [Parachlamydiales bacterium]
MKPPKAFTDLRQLSTEIHQLCSVQSLLHWDQETYMPSGGIVPRSEQIALLSELIHERRTGRKLKSCLEKLVSISTGKLKVKHLTKPQQIMVREWLKDFRRHNKLPAEFVKNFSQVTAEATQIWGSAKKENNFKIFAPFLDKIVKLTRQKAEYYGFEEHPYDALIETYEPCMTARKLETIFDGLKKELMALLKKINKAKQIDNRFLHRKVDAAKQHEMGELLLCELPMESAYTRLDVSNHPFSIALHPHDSRITTRIIPNQFMSNLFSILHEAGHSMFEMGLSLETWGTPLSEPVSLSVHESQSRWWETLIGRSFPFWKHFYPRLQKVLPTQLKEVSLDRFFRAINKVSPTLIRVEADEVTYCLHVILRFELEKDLITGKLNVHDLPAAWNEKMKQIFGIQPKTDREGCLQDIHWSLGDFGYFPTYALGNLLAAHLFTAFAKENSDWESQMQSGDLSFIRDWLKKNVHQWGRTYNLEELAKHVTGKPFSEHAYCAYLKKKYSEIYKIR